MPEQNIVEQTCEQKSWLGGPDEVRTASQEDRDRHVRPAESPRHERRYEEQEAHVQDARENDVVVFEARDVQEFVEDREPHHCHEDGDKRFQHPQPSSCRQSGGKLIFRKLKTLSEGTRLNLLIGGITTQKRRHTM